MLLYTEVVSPQLFVCSISRSVYRSRGKLHSASSSLLKRLLVAYGLAFINVSINGFDHFCRELQRSCIVVVIFSIRMYHAARCISRRYDLDSTYRHFQLNPILILEFDIGVRIFLSRDILKNNM